MTTKTFNYIIVCSLFAFLALSLSCERDLDEIEPATFPADGDVFIDNFSGGLQYAAFGGSDVTAFQVVQENTYSGTAAMRFAVPDVGDPKGAFAGGAFFVPGGRDLSGFNVLTFWARASKSANLDVLGFGNDLGANRFIATIGDVAVNTNWRKYYIPIPDPSKLTQEGGMFFYSEGPEEGLGYTFWIDEVRFENLGTVAHASAGIFNGEDLVESAETGNTFSANGFAEFNLPTGVNQRVFAAPAYFNYTSSNTDVATVSPTGVVTVIGAGEAVITAKLGEIDAAGSLRITSTGAPVLPAGAAPTPTQAQEDVISLFSNVYTNEPVDFFNGFWQGSTTQSEDVQIDGDDIIRYSQLNFVGIQFTAPTLDITGMTHIHLDIWTPDATDLPAQFKVLLFDLGPDGTFDGEEDNTSHELTLTSPTIRSNEWVSLDIPLTDFLGLTSRRNLAQVVLSGDLPNIFMDNLYFYDDGSGMGGPTEPTVGAPAPTAMDGDVISVFSDTYTNVDGTDFFPDWGQGNVVTQVDIAGNNTLRYSALDFQGIQLAGSLDVSGMEFLHIDYWTENSTALNAFLISTGPVETPFALNVPTSGWASVDIPLSAFNPVDLMDIIQFKFDGNGTIYLDNIYFFRGDGGGGGDAPMIAAPTPTQAQSDVISLFSEAYTDVAVDTWRTEWSEADFEDVTVAGNAAKKYSNLNFAGIETVLNTIDASEMTHFRVDVWSADYTYFALKLVDFGANGVFDGPGMGDDVEHEVQYPMPAQAQWVSFDIPLSDFTGLTTRSNIAQYIIVGQPTSETTLYLDNMYFYRDNDGGGGGNEPTAAAPAPTLPQANVISLFSDVYSDVPVDTWRTEWSDATFEDITVAGNATKQYTNLNFVGIETVMNQVDITGMTHFHIDIWTPNAEALRIKLVDFGANGGFEGPGMGDDTEHELSFASPTQGEWISLDIPLSDFVNLTSRGNLAQLILAGDTPGAVSLFVDNVYFHN